MIFIEAARRLPGAGPSPSKWDPTQIAQKTNFKTLQTTTSQKPVKLRIVTSHVSNCIFWQKSCKLPKNPVTDMTDYNITQTTILHEPVTSQTFKKYLNYTVFE